MLSIGIDFGTSNSSVAVYDGDSVRLLPLDAHARDAQVMRSLLYITREGEIVAGQRALDLYTEQNTGREVKLERRYIGEVKMVFSDMTVVKDAFAMVDVNEPGRLFQSLKRFLPVTSFKKTNVFGTEYRLEELVATITREMVRAAEAALGQRIDRIVAGRPVSFSADAAKDETARRRLEEAWRLAGVEHVWFLEEPVGAAHHYATEAQLAPGARFLVFDFGGGTLDITVARATGGDIEVLATGGVSIGGDLLDSRLMETRIAPRFGRGAHYRDGLPVPQPSLHPAAKLADDRRAEPPRSADAHPRRRTPQRSRRRPGKPRDAGDAQLRPGPLPRHRGGEDRSVDGRYRRGAPRPRPPAHGPRDQPRRVRGGRRRPAPRRPRLHRRRSRASRLRPRGDRPGDHDRRLVAHPGLPVDAPGGAATRRARRDRHVHQRRRRPGDSGGQMDVTFGTWHAWLFAR